MAKSSKTKFEFVQDLIARNFFWSYAISETTSLPDELLIEQVLGYGEPDDIVNLKRFFKLAQIKQVWQQHLLPDARYKNANVWLAKVFFNITRVDQYIEKYSSQNSRYDRLRLLAAKN